jgi:pilus assembly protein TadC
LVSVEFLEFLPGKVRSNADSAVERTWAFSSTGAYLRSPGTPLRASARPCLNQAVQSTFERTSIAFERTCRGCYIFERLRLIIVPALERISAAAAADQRQVCVLFFYFFYLFVYLFILPLFIYLLVVFSF